ncbi:MAG: Ornithine racemase [candidate division WS2 bacterium]|nr:Ornithine racemase [Candidatus Lithacetigena glycinireducens]
MQNTSFPKLRINLSKLKHNYHNLKRICTSFGIDLMPITKVALSYPVVVGALVEAGAKIVGDSRLINLQRVKDNFSIKTALIRMPSPLVAEEVINLADISMNSEISTLKSLGEIASKKGIVHQTIIMVEMGDLREGVPQEELIPFVSEALKIKGIEIIGLGSNLTCYGGVIPTRTKMEKFYTLKRKVEKACGLQIPYLSGGSSNLIHHLLKGIKIPVNHMRAGEGIFLGTESVNSQFIPGSYQDVFLLEAEVIEVKRKPSIPRGRRTLNAFGEVTHFKDSGIRTRALLSLGRQDIMLSGLKPVEAGVTILGASSDHLVLDVEERKTETRVGDIIALKMNYGALLQAMTSPFVNKVTDN